MNTLSLQDLKEQVSQLPASERLELMSVIIQSLQGVPQTENWEFLVARPHPWRKQLYIKGRKLSAFTVWQDMRSNGMTPEQAAENWDLPLGAVHEAIKYCEIYQDLLRLEAEEEKFRLQKQGVSVEPQSAG